MIIKSVFGFFADLFKQILIKVISFIIVVILVILIIKFVFKIDVFGLF